VLSRTTDCSEALARRLLSEHRAAAEGACPRCGAAVDAHGKARVPKAGRR
jgi:hypothetical protein